MARLKGVISGAGLICVLLVSYPVMAQVPLPLPRPESSTTPVPRPQRAQPVRPISPKPADIKPANIKTPGTKAPTRLYQAACPAILSGRVVAKLLPPIADGGKCGLQSPYEVSALVHNGHIVRLGTPATLNCAMATALADWVMAANSFARSRAQTTIRTINSGTSYQCRTRNNVADADLSEHGFGNAIDISGVVLDDDTQITVDGDWGTDSVAASILRHARDAACGLFTTVLSPDANAAHRDHLHLDLGCHSRRCAVTLCQ